MPSVTALRRCPDLIFVKPRFDAYREVSNRIRAIFSDYTPHVEPLSLDEAYLDVTEDLKGIGIATRDRRGDTRPDPGRDRPDRLGRRLLQQVPRQAGQRPEQAGRPVRGHPEAGAGLRRGASGQALPRRRPRHRGQDGAARDRDRRRPARARAWTSSTAHFGSSAFYYHDLARGICHRQVKADRPYKSVSAEDTFLEDLRDEAACSPSSTGSATPSGGGSRASSSPAGRSTSRSNIRISRSSPAPARSTGRCATGAEFLEIGAALLRTLLPPVKAIRLLGLGLSNLGDSMEAGAEPAELELPLQLADPV